MVDRDMAQEAIILAFGFGKSIANRKNEDDVREAEMFRKKWEEFRESLPDDMKIHASVSYDLGYVAYRCTIEDLV